MDSINVNDIVLLVSAMQYCTSCYWDNYTSWKDTHLLTTGMHLSAGQIAGWKTNVNSYSKPKS